MKIYTKSEIDHLAQQFGDKLLPKEEWTHEAHLLVAVWHNWNFDFDKAVELVRTKIKAYNEAVGTLNTDDSGYHETLTIFWMTICKQYLEEHRFETLEKFGNSFIESKWVSKSLPLSYYSREILFSVEARKTWIAGNLKKI